MGTDANYLVDRVGVFRPKQEMVGELGPGEIGFLTAAIKEVADTRVGDTVTEEKRPCAKALPGFKPAQPVVFAASSLLIRRTLKTFATQWASCG
jgi:GTP-binding protein LepA